MHEPHVAADMTRPPGRRRRRRNVRILVLSCVIILGVFMTGMAAGVVADQVLLNPTPATAVEVSEIPSAIKEAWALVHDHYVQPDKIDDQKMSAGAISGMLDTLDDQGHTRYLSPQEVAQHDETLSGSYVGVGIQVEERDNQIVVVAPITGSPAERAGVRSGDVLLTVDGRAVTGLSLDEVVNLVRGEEGSRVTLVFQRSSQDQPVSFTLQRARIEISSVDWTMLPNNVADIRISQFVHGTTDHLAQAIQQAEQAGATSIVLDLRNNPGGLVDEAIGVASTFLPPDTPVFISQVRSGDQTIHRARPSDVRTDLPVVVLINEGTASASEIVSGALKQNDRAELVGTTTFGTGTVLNQFGLSDGSAILLGTELWLTPNGQLIKDQGIDPDYRVTLDPAVAPFLPVGDASSPEAIEAQQKDVQLQAALRVLRGEPVPVSVVGGPGCLRCS